MVTRAIDFQEAVIGGAAHAVVGGIQRLAWEKEQTGFMTTGALIIGGLLLKSTVRNGMLATFAEAAYNGGAVVAGWVASERTFKLGSSATTPGALGGGRAGWGRGFLAGGRQPVRTEMAYSHPGVALLGVNPNTGEPILSSGI